MPPSPPSSARCSCGVAFQTFWLWADDERDDLMHVTDRVFGVPRHAEEIRAVSATDAAIAYDRRHEAEHDVLGPFGKLRNGRCARRQRLLSR